MNAIELRRKIEARAKVLSIPIEPSFTLSIISDKVREINRETGTSIETVTITTVLNTGVYELTGTTNSPFKIRKHVFPSVWDRPINVVTEPLLAEAKRSLANSEIATYTDQPQLFTIYRSNGKRYIEFFDSSTIAAGLTVTLDVETISTKTLVDGDVLNIQPDEFDELFYTCMEEMIDPELKPRTYMKYQQKAIQARKNRMRDGARLTHSDVHYNNIDDFLRS